MSHSPMLHALKLHGTTVDIYSTWEAANIDAEPARHRLGSHNVVIHSYKDERTAEQKFPSASQSKPAKPATELPKKDSKVAISTKKPAKGVANAN